MALIYPSATLTPSKLEVLRRWVPSREWSGGPDPSELEVVGSYRFDDPDGEVGVETHLLLAGPVILQVPVTYRAAPLAGAARSLIATVEHSVLGPRLVYDGCADPVYARALATAMLTGGTEADLDLVTDEGTQRRGNGTRVSGSGDGNGKVPIIDAVQPREEWMSTVMRAGGLQLVLQRAVGAIPDGFDHGAPSLIGTWPGQDYPVILAAIR